MFNKKNKSESKKGSKLYISRKSYSNPYFKDANKKTKTSFSSSITLKTKFVTFLFFILIFAFFGFIFYSKYFLIYDLSINIERVNNIGRINEEEVERIAREELRSRFVFLPGNNFFLFDEDKIFKRLDGDYAFEEISVSKKFPNKLFINLKEVSYALIWNERDAFYYVTTNGEIIDEIPKGEIREIFPLVENKGRDLIQGTKISDKDVHLEFAIKLYREFKDTNIFNIEKFIVGNKNDSTLTMKIFEGPDVHFNVNENNESQSDKLLLLKSEKLGDELYTKTYIDLRFGDMIYYR